MTRKFKGFTLIELLVVVAIIGLISSIAVVAMQNARAEARDAKRFADMEVVQKALELYYSEHGVYPGSDCYGLPSAVPCTSVKRSGNWISDLIPKYMTSLPDDPVNRKGSDPLLYCYTKTGDPDEAEANPHHYYLLYRLESEDQINLCDSPWTGWSSRCGGIF